jgi:hypothetical protein
MKEGTIKEQEPIPININFDAIINELAFENGTFRKEKAILTQQVQSLVGTVRELQAQLAPKQDQKKPA